MQYFHYQEKTITDTSDALIEQAYADGFVFTRLGKGIMHQINSVRIDLERFEQSSENRRVLKKAEGIVFDFYPLREFIYHWSIGSLAKTFYEVKFGKNIMTANKIKEMFTDPEKSNMNLVLVYSYNEIPFGYCICFSSNTTGNIIHYSYPFYGTPGLSIAESNKKQGTDSHQFSYGMIMMLSAIQWSKENGFKYIYLGSDQKYKHQFKDLEVFNPQDGWVKE